MDEKTTIQVSVKTRDQLVRLKAYPREPIGEVLERIINARARGILMDNYIVSVTDEETGALMSSWNFSYEEYIKLLKFIDSGGPSE